VSPHLSARFVAEYLIDLNATQAYMRAKPDCRNLDRMVFVIALIVVASAAWKRHRRR
jgi:hypothetical protein